MLNKKCLMGAEGSKWRDVQRTGINYINEEHRKRRWTWLGNVIRMQKEEILVALNWNPSGQKGVGGGCVCVWKNLKRMKGKKIAEVGKTWNEL